MDIDGKERSALLTSVDSALPVEPDAKGAGRVPTIPTGR